VVSGGAEPPTFRFQAHPQGRCTWLARADRRSSCGNHGSLPPDGPATRRHWLPVWLPNLVSPANDRQHAAG